MSITALPSMQHTFTISVKGTETAQMFDGTFTYQRPNLRLKSEIAKLTAELNGNAKSLDEDTKILHIVLATLKHTLIKFPEWWKEVGFGFELYDMNIPFEIYAECRKFETDWTNQVWKVEEEKK